MARAKKETALTPEERLQAALVPDWEWPYKLPENWCWTYFKSISTIQTGRKDANYGSDEGKYPFFTCAAKPIRCHGYSFDCRAILLAGNGDINNISRYNGKFEAYQRTYVVKIAEPLCFDYIFYWFKYRWFDFNKGKMFGTAIPYIRLGNLQEFPTPIPPLAEQQRIVDRIESLFAKLDEAKEKAQAVVDSFEARKAAILHKAFTGELTAKWREEHGVGMERWEKKSVGELCISLKYGTAKKSDASGNVVVLRMGNLQQGEIDWSDLAYSNDPDDIEKYKLFPGDVLFNRTNSAALVGKTAIYRGEHPAIYAGYLIKLDYDHDKIIGDYLNYALNTLDAKKYCNSVKTDGVNQSNINAKKIGAYSFNVPSIPEQEKIVSAIQKLLSKEQQTKEAAEIVLDQIELMKKSILARAFRGELGTNDPSEESAVELLRQVIEQEDGDVIRPKAKAKRIAIPAEIKPLLSGANEEAIVKLLLKAAPQSVSTQTVMSISKKKFELMDALRNLEKKQIVSKSDSGEYSLVR